MSDSWEQIFIQATTMNQTEELHRIVRKDLAKKTKQKHFIWKICYLRNLWNICDLRRFENFRLFMLFILKF